MRPSSINCFDVRFHLKPTILRHRASGFRNRTDAFVGTFLPTGAPELSSADKRSGLSAPASLGRIDRRVDDLHAAIGGVVFVFRE